MSRYAYLAHEHAGVRVIARLGPLAVCAERFEPETLHHHQYFVCRHSHLDAAMAARASRRLFTG